MSETILVADPNMQFLDHTRYLLEKEGYQFLQAINGEEAKMKLELDPVDLFLVNVEMPNIDGPSLCEYIKTDLNRPIPSALMIPSGTAPLSESERSKADALLIRPLRSKELMSCIQSLQTIRSLLIQTHELRRRLSSGEGASDSSPNLPPSPPQSQPPAPQQQQEEEDSPLYPMSWFRKLATLEVKRSIRFHQPLSLLVLAYDMTEEYLQAIDQSTLKVLSDALAESVHEVIRAIDIPVQFSGEHILILLPNTGIEGAIQGATRIKHEILQRLPYKLPANWQAPTIGIGVTTSSTHGEFKFTDLLRDATRALRDVRSRGGDGVGCC